MLKWSWVIGLVFLFVSCQNKQAKPIDISVEQVDTLQVDTLPEVNTDSIQLSEIMQPKPHVQVGNELFEDFIFNFAADEELQLKRVKFPISYYREDTILHITPDEWKHDKLFTEESFYTLMFDDEADMEMEGDTTLNSVQVEYFMLESRKVKRYYFQRIEGVWILEAVNIRKVQSDEENEDFLQFYTRFATDTLYQEQHMTNPLQFVTIDPEDEFSILQATLTQEQWNISRPYLPNRFLTNISYGQRNDDNSNTKILKLNGIANGYTNLFYFRKVGDTWRLYRYEDVSI